MKRIYRLTALVAVIAALLTLACGCSLFEVEPTFSTDLWLEKPDERTAIIDDLPETHELKGMTAQEVVDLLGPHDNIAGYFVQEDRYVYYLGPVARTRITVLERERFFLFVKASLGVSMFENRGASRNRTNGFLMPKPSCKGFAQSYLGKPLFCHLTPTRLLSRHLLQGTAAPENNIFMFKHILKE